MKYLFYVLTAAIILLNISCDDDGGSTPIVVDATPKKLLKSMKNIAPIMMGGIYEVNWEYDDSQRIDKTTFRGRTYESRFDENGNEIEGEWIEYLIIYTDYVYDQENLISLTEINTLDTTKSYIEYTHVADRIDIRTGELLPFDEYYYSTLNLNGDKMVSSRSQFSYRDLPLSPPQDIELETINDTSLYFIYNDWGGKRDTFRLHVNNDIINPFTRYHFSSPIAYIGGESFDFSESKGYFSFYTGILVGYGVLDRIIYNPLGTGQPSYELDFYVEADADNHLKFVSGPWESTIEGAMFILDYYE